MSLNARQQRFVDEYLIDLNATQAAIRAGYSAKTAYSIGGENLKKPEIERAIQKVLSTRSERTEITAAYITDQLLDIAARARLMDGTGAMNIARQSFMDVAKLNGLVVETHENITRSAEERRARLNELRSEQQRLTRSH